MSRTLALRPWRQLAGWEGAIASTSRATTFRAVLRPEGCHERSQEVRSATASKQTLRHFSRSVRRERPPPPAGTPEPAVSRPLDSPPSPIAPPGRQKPPSQIQYQHQHHKNTIPSQKDEACQTLSPSSPSAPRSQAASTAVDKGKAKETVESSSMASAIPPEIVNKPSIGRKGSGKAFKAQKAALTMTPTAMERLRALQNSSGGPRLIRIGVRNKGCAGMSYHLEYVTPDQAGKFDERVKQDGVEVLIDSKALFSIIGSEMDWQEDHLSAKFVFNNPNVVEACGCGESVRFG